MMAARNPLGGAGLRPSKFLVKIELLYSASTRLKSFIGISESS